MSVGSVFHNFVASVEKRFLTNAHQEVQQKAQTVRIASIVASVLSAIGGAFFTSTALSSAGVTFGFSMVLLVPAAALFLVAFESYKVMRCTDIVCERAKKAEGLLGSVVHTGKDVAAIATTGWPLWAQSVQKEINDTFILSWISSQSAK